MAKIFIPRIRRGEGRIPPPPRVMHAPFPATPFYYILFMYFSINIWGFRFLGIMYYLDYIKVYFVLIKGLKADMKLLTSQLTLNARPACSNSRGRGAHTPGFSTHLWQTPDACTKDMPASTSAKIALAALSVKPLVDTTVNRSPWSQ